MIWLLLVLFQIKHFVADYLLQNEYMLGKFKDKGWALPLSTHCFVHAWLTFCIAINVTSLGLSLLVSTLDFGLHFIMDRVKASPAMLGKHKALTSREYKAYLEDIQEFKITAKELREKGYNDVSNYTGAILEREKKLNSNTK